MNTDIKTLLAGLSAEQRQFVLKKIKERNTEPSTAKFVIPRIERKSPLPLSFAQQRLWLHEQMQSEEKGAYLVPAVLKITGELDSNILERCFQTLEQRHESLRTSFPSIDGEPIQDIAEQIQFRLQHIDYSHIDSTLEQQTIQTFVQQERKRPWNLHVGPLWRGSLLRFDSQHHVLVLMIHHIINDGWSLGILINEMTALYKACRQGQVSPLSPLTIQYADFAVWQRQFLSDTVLQKQIDYWRQQLQGIPALLELPTDKPRPALQTYHGWSEFFNIDSDLTEKLRTLSQQYQTTLYMTLLSAFQILLMRISGQTDIVVGSPIANRRQTELEGIIGFFVNTLVLRNNLSADLSFKNLLEQTQRVTLQAYAHQDVPFEKLVEELNPVRSNSYHPLFQVMFVLQNTPMQTVTLPGITLQPMVVRTEIAKFDFILTLTETETGLAGEWEYNRDLWEHTTIQRLVGHLKTLLENIVAEPEQTINRLGLLTATEQQTLLVDWNKTQENFPQEQCIHQLFEQQVALRPSAIAVTFAEQTLTYAELNNKANQLAHYLIAEAIQPDDLVGLSLERSLEMIIALVAIWKAGAAYVPLDPAYPLERRAYILQDTQVKVLLTQTSLLEQLPATNAKIICMDSDWQAITTFSSNNPNIKVTPQHLAYVIYTSGSTGKPKGVMIEHQSLVNVTRCTQKSHRIDHNSRILQFASLSFDGATCEFIQSLPWGANLHLASYPDLLPGKELIKLINQHAITHITLPPSALAMLTPQSVPSLQMVAVAGEACPQPLAQQWSATHRFLNLYGPTEASIWVTYYEYQTVGKPVYIGRPINNVQIYILDKQLQPVPIGVTGELYIAGVQLARGYLHQPELTSEKFILDAKGTRLYKTGDLARYHADGNLEYLGRIDNLVKLRGFRIELSEIEAVLNSHEAIRDSIVIAREDNSDDKRLVAYLITTKTLQQDELYLFLKQSLPDYMIPAAFVLLDNFPVTPNGKIDRKVLPEPKQTVSDQSVAAATEMEQKLLAIWKEILKINDLGVCDNFFARGGHSLLAVKVLANIQTKLGIEIPLRDLLVRPTVRELAALLERHSINISHSNVAAIRVVGTKAPIFFIHPGEGEVAYCLDMEPHLPKDVPIYGIAARGFLAGETPLESVVEMAALYLQNIRKLQPQGPYRLVGWSAGGTIAYEMAQQLLKNGETVSLLGLIDTAPHYHLPNEQAVPLSHVPMGEGLGERANEAKILSYWLEKRLPIIQHADIKALADNNNVEALMRQLILLDPNLQNFDEVTLQRHFAVRRANIKALLAYKLLPLSSALSMQIALFTAAFEQREEDFAAEWRKLLGEKLQVIPIAASHYSIVQAPQAKQVGDVLTSYL